MRVIGICRFSYPAVGGFKRMHDTIEAREAYLYAPERMALRFRHFECLTLPSIAAQTDPDFTFLVLIGDSLPQRYRDRLHDLTAGMPQIRIVESPPMRHRPAMQAAITQALGPDAPESVQFRLDDDDAVATNFVSGLRWFLRHTQSLRRNWRSMAVEYSGGFAVRLSAQGIAARQLQTGFWACGLAVWFRQGVRKTVMNFAHHKLHHTMPTLIHPKPLMYLRAAHDDNDSAAGDSSGTLSAIDDDQRALFRHRFNVDEDRVKAAFSAPVGFRDTV
ncbi:glycosyltransferase [Roseovarius sp. SYSU LYC5161]|uniref:glycosyltransferase n=1 Tax=Roseovarius halophilus (ex Wu et al. 2025) TaxID=3376060 RepID=UPI00399B38AF